MRAQLIQEILAHPASPEEAAFTDAMIGLLKGKDECFYRTCFEPGHITGSALLTDATGQLVLLNHHKFLNKWLAFGGHADGNESIREVALREAVEESGFQDIEFVTSEIFDIDIHVIPANPRKQEPEHSHFDLSFLLRLKPGVSPTFSVSDESHDLRWCDAAEALRLVEGNGNMGRLIRKWAQHCGAEIAA